jgi:molybdopterin synthase sulfur carrier subunit
VDGQARLEVAGATVREVLGALAERHPSLRGRLFTEKGELNRFVNVFLNDEDVRFLQNLDTPVKDGDGVMLVPAIAGGAGTGASIDRPHGYHAESECSKTLDSANPPT